MPRDGSGIYTTPAGTTAVPDTTIESSKYNGNIADVAADLNAPRPIIAGGTGATSAAAARTNLGAEARSIQVTNYDTHVFEPGSFFSVPGATGEPVAGKNFSGICTKVTDAAFYIEGRVAEADTAHDLWVRRYWGGWQAWEKHGGSLAGDDARYVNTTGDTMTGDLTINKAGATLNITSPSSTVGDIWFTRPSGGGRWILRNGNNAETGANEGSDFFLYGLSDTGVVTSNPIYIKRSNGTVTFNSSVQFNGTMTANAAMTIATGGLNVTGGIIADTVRSTNWLMTGDATTGLLYLNNTATKYLQFDGTRFILQGGNLNCSGNIYAAGSVNATDVMQVNGSTAGAAPSYWVGNAAGAGRGMFRWDGNINTIEMLHADAGYAGVQINTAGLVMVGHGIKCRAGSSGGMPGYDFNLNWTTTQLECWIGATMAGIISGPSDYRIKKDVTDLDSQWSAVKALRPIKYTQANFTAPAEIEARAKEALRLKTLNEEKAAKGEDQIDTKPAVSGHTFVADDVERWGFVAHELQETLIPSAATGAKDSPDIVQSPNQWTVIAALTTALQEAMARIEALEAAAAVPVR